MNFSLRFFFHRKFANIFSCELSSFLPNRVGWTCVIWFRKSQFPFHPNFKSEPLQPFRKIQKTRRNSIHEARASDTKTIKKFPHKWKSFPFISLCFNNFKLNSHNNTTETYETEWGTSDRQLCTLSVFVALWTQHTQRKTRKKSSPLSAKRRVESFWIINYHHHHRIDSECATLQHINGQQNRIKLLSRPRFTRLCFFPTLILLSPICFIYLSKLTKASKRDTMDRTTYIGSESDGNGWRSASKSAVKTIQSGINRKWFITWIKKLSIFILYSAREFN